MRFILAPVKRDGLGGRVGFLGQQFAVGQHFVPLGHRGDQLGALPDAGTVKTGNPMAGLDRLALAPDREGDVGFRFCRGEKVQPAFRVANLVFDCQIAGRPGGERGLERDDQLEFVMRELGRRRRAARGGKGHRLHFESLGIEGDQVQFAIRLDRQRRPAIDGFPRQVDLHFHLQMPHIDRAVARRAKRFGRGRHRGNRRRLGGRGPAGERQHHDQWNGKQRTTHEIRPFEAVKNGQKERMARRDIAREETPAANRTGLAMVYPMEPSVAETEETGGV